MNHIYNSVPQKNFAWLDDKRQTVETCPNWKKKEKMNLPLSNHVRFEDILRKYDYEPKKKQLHKRSTGNAHVASSNSIIKPTPLSTQVLKHQVIN